MSILQTPRIHFKGQMSWDPIVTNNYPTFYNENKAETVMPLAESMQQFRQSAIASVSSKAGNWNTDGTHRSAFFNTFVSAVDLGNGLVTTDKLCGAPAILNSMLVDLEPYGGITSQLFFDGISFGINGGCRIAAKCNQRFSARYINFQRNSVGYIAGVASVNWQTSFSKDTLQIDAHKSEALAALQAALNEPDAQGIVVSFNAYRTVYFDNPGMATASASDNDVQWESLHQKLVEGGFQPNPARSMIVGTIGVWRKGEPMLEPGDRALLPVDGAKAFVATAHARYNKDKRIMTVDLSNSVSETGMDLTKQDLGRLDLCLNGDLDHPIASIEYHEYDRSAYEAGSGIVNFDLGAANPADVESGDLALSSQKYGLLLQESALRLIPQTPNLYLDQGPAGAVTFQMYQRGKPSLQSSDVTLFTMNAVGTAVKATQNLQTDPKGQLTVSANADKGDVYAYVPVPTKDAPAPAGGIDTQASTYAYVRVLPADSQLNGLPASWDNVYRHVLINWKAMAPCMDNWLDLADPVQVHNYAPVLKRLTDPNRFEDYIFMPVTRDMTVGQRALLYSFLDQPLAEDAVPGQAQAEGQPPAPARGSAPEKDASQPAEGALPHFARRSRSLRDPSAK